MAARLERTPTARSIASSSPDGSGLALVVTLHTPFLRYHGRDPFDEDALHLLIAETLVPLLNTLHDLRSNAIPARMSLACSAVLLDQLADPVVQKHFLLWMDSWLSSVEASLRHWTTEAQRHQRYLAQFYLEWGETVRASFQERYHRNLVVALRELCEAGVVEPLLLPATNAPLPSLSPDSAVRAQLETALLATLRHLGQQPKGLWLPDGYRPGLDELLQRIGLSYLVLPGSSVEEGVSGWLLNRRVSAVTRDDALEQFAFSEAFGYPGDPLYRAPVADGTVAYRRIGDADPESLAGWYDPYLAFRRAEDHANHFLAALDDSPPEERGEGPALRICGLDAGHGATRWFELNAWLRHVFELAALGDVPTTTPGSYLYQHPPRRSVRPLPQPAPRLELAGRLAQATRRMSALALHFPAAESVRERLLNQAGRELLLAQDGAWANDERGYLAAERRLELFEWLSERAERGTLSADELAELEAIEDRDNVFPLLNYRVFEG